MPLWQYQQIAEPIPTPTTSPAVVSLEWVAQWPDRLPPPPHRLEGVRGDISGFLMPPLDVTWGRVFPGPQRASPRIGERM